MCLRLTKIEHARCDLRIGTLTFNDLGYQIFEISKYILLDVDYAFFFFPLRRITSTMGVDLEKSVACTCTNAVRTTDPIGGAAKPQNGYVFVRTFMRARTLLDT